MQNILLDTNIAIYLLNGNTFIISWLKDFRGYAFSISIITWIEVLAGSFHHKKTTDEIRVELQNFNRIALDEVTAQKAGVLIAENIERGRKKNFQDSVIAATALTHKILLFTNNPKDFQGIKGLKIMTPEKFPKL